jgi:hypothetical protein
MPMFDAILPLSASIISLLFAVIVGAQFFKRRKAHQLIWFLGLLMYAVSTGAEFWTETYGLADLPYKLWYLFGAILVAAYLGMGTVYLLFRKTAAHIIMAILGAATLYAVYAVFTAHPDLSAIETLTGKAMPASVRMLTPFFNSFGTLALVGGAVFSAWRFWRKREMGYRVLSNLLIAAGAILPAAGGAAMRLGASSQILYLLELGGIFIIFLGFLRSQPVFAWREPPAAEE